jgi:hypothetical protein
VEKIKEEEKEVYVLQDNTLFEIIQGERRRLISNLLHKITLSSDTMCVVSGITGKTTSSTAVSDVQYSTVIVVERLSPYQPTF